MSKFCKNCGAELADTAAFCKECGSSVANNITVEASQTKTPYASESGTGSYTYEIPAVEENSNFVDKINNKDRKTFLILACVGLALVLCVVFVVVFSGGGSSAEEAFDKYIKVVYNGDVDLIEELAPEAYWEHAKDEYDIKVKDVNEYYEDEFEKDMDKWEDKFGDNIDVSYEIIGTDTVSESKLDKIKSSLKSSGISKKDIEDAVELEVEITIKGDDDEDSAELECYAVQISGEWYICHSKSSLVSNGSFAVNDLVYMAYCEKKGIEY